MSPYEENLERKEDWRKAGKIAGKALHYGRSLIKPGASFLEVSDRIEERILSLGGQIAFPAQMSFDHVAAHNCADPDDKTLFSSQVVCLDVGVHVDGAIGDTALTVDLSGKHAELVKASEDALKAASKILAIGTTLGEIGKEIENAIMSHGYTPIHNLSGHGLGFYSIHTPPSVPNFNTRDDTPLEKGMVIAIEPFATDGAGMIYETDSANIFSFARQKPVRSAITREVLSAIKLYSTLPFTTRWLTRKLPAYKVNFGLKDLLQNGIIRKYPPLPDRNRGLVSQAEHTFFIDDKVEVLTSFKEGDDN